MQPAELFKNLYDSTKRVTLSEIKQWYAWLSEKRYESDKQDEYFDLGVDEFLCETAGTSLDDYLQLHTEFLMEEDELFIFETLGTVINAQSKDTFQLYDSVNKTRFSVEETGQAMSALKWKLIDQLENFREGMRDIFEEPKKLNIAAGLINHSQLNMN